MGYSDIPVKTEIQQLLEQQAALTEAVNGLGKNVQWIIDNVQGIFQMFGSPQMMAMLPAMMNGAMGAVPAESENPE